MEVGIIGLSQSGKTTIFTALSKGSSSTNLSPALANKINFGVAKVPDIRMKPLQEMFKPQKTTYAEVRYTDLPTSSDRTSRDQGITGESLNLLQRTDAIVNVVRAFDNPVVPHIEGSIDPKRDLQNMTMELVLSDLLIIERRLTKLSGELKNTKEEMESVKGVNGKITSFLSNQSYSVWGWQFTSLAIDALLIPSRRYFVMSFLCLSSLRDLL